MMGKNLDFEYLYNIKTSALISFNIGIDINCSQQKLWNLLRAPQHLKLTHPYCKDHIAKKWGDVGDKHLLIFNSGIKVIREITEMGTDFFLLNLIQDEIEENEIKVRFEARQLTDEKCRLNMTLSMDSYKKMPELNWTSYANSELVPGYELYLSSVVLGYKYYLENNEAVVKNQFGYHSNYSTK